MLPPAPPQVKSLKTVVTRRRTRRNHVLANPALCLACLLVILLLSPLPARAASRLSINVSTGTAVVTAGPANSTIASVTVNTAWDMPGIKNVNVATCTYMLSGLTSPGGPTVPVSDVRVIQGASTRTMVSQPNCNNAGALRIGSSFIIDNNSADPATRSRNGFRADTMQLQIVNTGTLLPGTYTGTIVVSALVY